MSNPPKVILLSGKAEAGKSTIGAYLWHQYGYWPLSFADPIYEGLAGLSGKSTDWLRMNKSERLPGFNQTVRHCLQTLGTEWGRVLCNEDVWALRAIERMANIWGNRMEDGDSEIVNPSLRGFVIDDCRFRNEYHCVDRWARNYWNDARATYSIRVIRPDHQVTTIKGAEAKHASEEMAFTSGIPHDMTIANTDTREELQHMVKLWWDARWGQD